MPEMSYRQPARISPTTRSTHSDIKTESLPLAPFERQARDDSGSNSAGHRARAQPPAVPVRDGCLPPTDAPIQGMLLLHHNRWRRIPRESRSTDGQLATSHAASPTMDTARRAASPDHDLIQEPARRTRENAL